MPPIHNPAKLFQGLFVNSRAEQRQAERTRLTHKSSVLDALRDSANALNRTLNAPDRDKLNQYLTSVRDVERRLQISIAWVDRAKPKSSIKRLEDDDARARRTDKRGSTMV